MWNSWTNRLCYETILPKSLSLQWECPEVIITPLNATDITNTRVWFVLLIYQPVEASIYHYTNCTVSILTQKEHNSECMAYLLGHSHRTLKREKPEDDHTAKHKCIYVQPCINAGKKDMGSFGIYSIDARQWNIAWGANEISSLVMKLFCGFLVFYRTSPYNSKLSRVMEKLLGSR